MIGRLSFIAALLAAPMALAQDTPTPPTAGQIAAARAEADRIIAAADADALFVNITGDARATVRHKASGMICTFFGSPEVDRIVIFDGKGNDVGCSTRLDDYKMELTLYATRYEPMLTEQQALASAVSAIRDRFPSARPFEGSVGEVGVGSDIRPLSESLLIETTQGPMFTMAIVSHPDEWAFKARATGPEVHGTEISVAAGVGFYRMLVLRTLPD